LHGTGRLSPASESAQPTKTSVDDSCRSGPGSTSRNATPCKTATGRLAWRSGERSRRRVTRRAAQQPATVENDMSQVRSLVTASRSTPFPISQTRDPLPASNTRAAGAIGVVQRFDPIPERS
jgi:hypothetical protein